jgi:hypothetical protein
VPSTEGGGQIVEFGDAAAALIASRDHEPHRDRPIFELGRSSPAGPLKRSLS